MHRFTKQQEKAFKTIVGLTLSLAIVIACVKGISLLSENRVEGTTQSSEVTESTKKTTKKETTQKETQTAAVIAVPGETGTKENTTESTAPSTSATQKTTESTATSEKPTSDNAVPTSGSTAATESTSAASEKQTTTQGDGGEYGTDSTGVKYKIVTPDPNDYIHVVVNKYRRVSESYCNSSVKTAQILSTGVMMYPEAAKAYGEMYLAAKKDGIILTPVSGYRSYARQKNNYQNRIKRWQSQGYGFVEAEKRTAEVILPPGSSEHNLGLAMDIISLKDSFANTKEYKWLTENAQNYGFILRYTAANKKYTGIVPEPWHWRYVGVETAKAMYGTGMCLEQYMGVN